MTTLHRGMTAEEFIVWMDTVPKLKSLTDVGMRDGVDGDLCIDQVSSTSKACPESLVHLFHEGSSTGARAKLAQLIHTFLKVEQQVDKQEAQQRRTECDTAKHAKLRVAIAEEEKKRVDNSTMQLAFVAAHATVSAGVHDRDAMRQAYFEKHGHKFVVNISEPTQVHHQYLLDNTESCIALLNGADETSGEAMPAKLISSSKGLKKKKSKSTLAVTHTFEIHVSGAFLKKVFAERSANNEDLRLYQPEGPFSMPYFISLVSAARKDVLKSDLKRSATATPEELEKERDVEVEKASTRGAKIIASAEVTLKARLMELEKVHTAFRTRRIANVRSTRCARSALSLSLSLCGRWRSCPRRHARRS